MLGIGMPNIVFKRSGGGGFSFTFTSTGLTGSVGPTLGQCQTAYAGQAFLTGSFSVTGGKQSLTITTAGTYRIIANGAAGGQKVAIAAGKGATVQGDFTLAIGDVIQMLVGQRGSNAIAGDGNSNGGGGGGSYVLKNGTVILVAGGGGGSGKYSTNADGPGRNASTGSSGVQGAILTPNGNPGTNGYGGGYSSNNILYGTGGGGYFGSGLGNGGYGNGGIAYILGGTGGTGYSNLGNGGFGGGGGGGFTCGGAGGGYSGGGAAYFNGEGAGGGGSYNIGSSPVNSIQATVATGSIQITAI